MTAEIIINDMPTITRQIKQFLAKSQQPITWNSLVNKTLVYYACGSELFLETQTVNQPRYWRGFVRVCPVSRGFFLLAYGGLCLAERLRLAAGRSTTSFNVRMRSAAYHAVDRVFFREIQGKL